MKNLIGHPVMFFPCYLYNKELHSSSNKDIQPVRGVIEYINTEHGWFRIRYNAGNTVQHECFKLVDIGKGWKDGKDVTLCGHQKNC